MKVEYVSHMGNDNFIANVARVSFEQSDDFDALPDGYDVERRDGLLGYLAGNGHWTPFAHPQVCLLMQAPVPIRTQCFKHKVGFVENEESRRYISRRPEFFTPSEIRGVPEGSIKQGSSGVHPKSEDILAIYQDKCKADIALYEEFIRQGVCPEQARFLLPQACEVNWVWTGSLASWARFVKQRSDSHAQKEIQELAAMVDAIIRPLYPVAWSKLVDA